MSGTYLHLSVRKIVVSHSVDVCLQQTRLKEVTNHQKEKKKRPTAIMTWNKCMGSWTHVGFVGKSPSAEVVAACGELPSPKYEDSHYHASSFWILSNKIFPPRKIGNQMVVTWLTSLSNERGWHMLNFFFLIQNFGSIIESLHGNWSGHIEFGLWAWWSGLEKIEVVDCMRVGVTVAITTIILL